MLTREEIENWDSSLNRSLREERAMDAAAPASGGKRNGLEPRELPHRESPDAGRVQAHSFTREEHQALHALTLSDLVRDSWCFRTLADVPVRAEVVEKLKALGLARVNLKRPAQQRRPAIWVAQITRRGRMVAEHLGAPGLFPLSALAT